MGANDYYMIIKYDYDDRPEKIYGPYISQREARRKEKELESKRDIDEYFETRIMPN